MDKKRKKIIIAGWIALLVLLTVWQVSASKERVTRYLHYFLYEEQHDSMQRAREDYNRRMEEIREVYWPIVDEAKKTVEEEMELLEKIEEGLQGLIEEGVLTKEELEAMSEEKLEEVIKKKILNKNKENKK